MATEKSSKPAAKTNTKQPAAAEKSPHKAAVMAQGAKAKAEAAEARAMRAEAKLEKFKAVAVTKGLAGRQVQGFVDFLREQSVVGLAIGLVLGTQVKALVDQMVLSFFNPLIGLILPGEGTLKEKFFEITFNGKTEKFLWGSFLSTLITFVIVAAIVYYVFKGLGLDKLDKKKE